MHNANAFFDILARADAISPVWRYILTMLCGEYELSDEIQCLFIIFWALIDDGNVCISLDEKTLIEKWNKKLAGLEIPDQAPDYNTIIGDGIRALKTYAKDNDLIFEYVPDTTPQNAMFVICDNWLFTDKFFAAKQEIEQSVRQLFMPRTAAAIDDKMRDRLRERLGYPLASQQADAVIRAKNGENLIITGGPGTGKTTNIYYLLLELLAENASRPIYMAALSGKAKNRMQESITVARTHLKDTTAAAYQSECDIISNVKPVTIHSLLGINGGMGGAGKTFPSNSIFVIDEASMIDIDLFAKLLRAIRQCENARVFILGDKDQLPSVQPGAVFADLTKTCRHSLIELTQTKRFPENSAVFALKEYVRQPDTHPISLDDWVENIADNWCDELRAIAPRTFDVKYLNLADDAIGGAVINWYNGFYDNTEYDAIYRDLDLESDETVSRLNAIWARIENAKILCAENHGVHGTDRINKIISDYITAKHGIVYDNANRLFVGEQIIITQNQHLYDLSNGDIGIIASLDGVKHIMIKRIKKPGEPYRSDPKELIRHIDNYVFYPLYLLPTHAIAPAYAITIHKSQGSEYDNICVFLPASEKSPLLNRQILYTAITRTKNMTYIVSNRHNMETAIATSADRDTQLCI